MRLVVSPLAHKLVRVEGLAPPRSFDHQTLNLARLLLRHTRKVNKVMKSRARRIIESEARRDVRFDIEHYKALGFDDEQAREQVRRARNPAHELKSVQRYRGHGTEHAGPPRPKGMLMALPQSSSYPSSP